MADNTGYSSSVGTPHRPYDDVYLKDDDGNAQSVKELIRQSQGVPEQPFIVDKITGDVVMVAKGNAGTGSGSTPSGGFLLATYVGDDQPGEGDNQFAEGYSRFWRTMQGKVHLVTRIHNLYFWVEATNRDSDN